MKNFRNLQVLVACSTLLTFVCTYAELVMAIRDQNLVHKLQRDTFFTRNSVVNVSDPIDMLPSAVGLPDLPDWLQFIQRNDSQDGYLYGTPQSVTQEELQVVAVNKNSFQTAVRNINISVIDSSVTATFKVQLRIRNFDLDEMLANNNLPRLRNIVKSQWQDGGDVYVTRVMSLQQLGERVLVPSSPGVSGVKQGVMVEVGGNKGFSDKLRSIPIEINTASCKDGGDDQPQVTLDTLFKPIFVVDWCSYNLISPDRQTTLPSSNTIQPAHIPLTDGVFQPKHELPGRRKLFNDFIVVAVVPLAVLVILLILLSSLFFGFREGLEKRSRLTSDIQLQHYSSIRRATTNLRKMSEHRDEPSTVTPTPGLASPDSATSPDFQPRDRSTPFGYSPNTSRSMPPPPYVLPPSFPAETSMISEEPSFDREQTNSKLRLVPKTSASRKD